MPTETSFGMRLAPQERRQIERLAKARGTSMKDAVLDAVRSRLDDLAEAEVPPAAAPGRLRDAAHLVGCFDGPADLSTNPAHLDGYGG